MLVQGTFACSNVSYVPLQVSERSVVAKLGAYFAWAKEDARVAGINPWHFNNRSIHPSRSRTARPVRHAGCGSAPAVAIDGDGPTVVKRLQQIGRCVIDAAGVERDEP